MCSFISFISNDSSLSGPSTRRNSALTLNYDVHIFYYAWYGNPATGKKNFIILKPLLEIIFNLFCLQLMANFYVAECNNNPTVFICAFPGLLFFIFAFT